VKKDEVQKATVVQEAKVEAAPVAKIVTGNEEQEELTEDVKPSDQLSRIRKLAGLAR
jgi:hypothetical protein